MKVIHYTEHKNFKLKQIIIKNRGKGSLSIKPATGLWCSPLNSKWGWKDWCKSEEFGNIDKCKKIILDIDMKNIVKIDSVKDMENKLVWKKVYSHMNRMIGFIPVRTHHFLFWRIDFEKMVEDYEIDGIYLTQKGERETRFSEPKHLYGWDCETVLILNERCIKNNS